MSAIDKIIKDMGTFNSLAKTTKEDIETLDKLAIQDINSLDKYSGFLQYRGVLGGYSKDHSKITSEKNELIKYLDEIITYSENLKTWLTNLKGRNDDEIIKIFTTADASNNSQSFSDQIIKLSNSFEIYLNKLDIELNDEKNVISSTTELGILFKEYENLVKKLANSNYSIEDAGLIIKESFIQYIQGFVFKIKDVNNASNELSKISRIIDYMIKYIFNNFEPKGKNLNPLSRKDEIKEFVNKICIGLRNQNLKSESEIQVFLETIAKSIKYQGFSKSIDSEFNVKSNPNKVIIDKSKPWLQILVNYKVPVQTKDNSGNLSNPRYLNRDSLL